MTSLYRLEWIRSICADGGTVGIDWLFLTIQAVMVTLWCGFNFGYRIRRYFNR